jgi:hypothetical protein
MRMKHSKAIGIGSAILFAVLWSFPLARAITYFHWAQEYFAQTSSVDASNDVSLSRTILASYVVSLLAALALSWLRFRCSNLVFLLPFNLACSVVIGVILFPTIMPFIPALLNLAALALGSLLHYGARLSERLARNVEPNRGHFE